MQKSVLGTVWSEGAACRGPDRTPIPESGSVEDGPPHNCEWQQVTQGPTAAAERDIVVQEWVY